MTAPTPKLPLCAALLAGASLWLGLLLGVSFLATTVKFNAPSLSLPVALDVGRATFAVFNPVEWIMAAILLGLSLVSRRLGAIVPAILVCVALAVQTFWLLPVLDARVSLILMGTAMADSNHHLLYIAADVLKAMTLTAVIAMAWSWLTDPRAP
jgi:hypothetical protein